MSNGFMRSLLVVFLVLTLTLLSVGIVSANCYVTADWCSSSESDACTLSQINNKQCKTVNGNFDSTCFFDPDATGMVDDCTAICCCDSITKEYTTGSTKGICTLKGNQVIPTLDPAQCAATCNAATSQSFSLTGIVKYNNQPVANADITLSNTYTVKTNANGYYAFLNIPSGQYVLGTTSNCGYSQNINLDSTKQWDINLQCVSVKISGYTKESDDTIVRSAQVTLDNNGVKTSITSHVNTGYYEFTVLQGSKVTITAKKSGTECSGAVPDITVSNVNINRDITIQCASYDVNVNVMKDGQVITDANVFNNIGQTATYRDPPGSYPFEVYPVDNLKITANKIYSSSANGNYITTECIASSDLTINSASPATQTINLVFDNDDNCCTKTITYSECTNGFMTRITRYSGSCAYNTDGTLKQADTAPVSCDTPLKPCEWDCEWTTCSAGEVYATGTCDNKIQTADCDMSLPTPLPRLTKPCPGNEMCGNGILDGSESCDYNVYTQTLSISDTCANSWININPTDNIQTKSDIFTNGLAMSACSLYDCSCATPRTVDVPIDQCVSNPATLNEPLEVTNILDTYNFEIKWNVNNAACNKYVDHFELKVCNNNGGEESGCAKGNYNIIDNTIDKNTLELIHDGSLTSSQPKILPRTEYCYELSMIYTTALGLNAKTSVEECITTGDAVCMKPHEDSWCSNNGVVWCDQNNMLISAPVCKTDETCWFNDATSSASCIDQEDCQRCNGVLGLYSYMGYDIPTSKPQTGSTTNFYKIACPSFSDPAPNPGSGKPFSQYIFGCYMDYSRTTTNAIYSCENVNSCYDYTSEDSCVQDYCDKFTVTKTNGCEWNEYAQGTATKNKVGKGICAPKNVETQQCELCLDPEYNRLSSSCVKDICELYGEVNGVTNCYFDNYSSQCWNKNEVTCDMYMTESSCNGVAIALDGTVSGRDNVFTNVKWLSDENDEVAGNKKISRYETVTEPNNKNPGSDGAGVGVCKWVKLTPENDVYQCIRDADNAYYPLEYDCNTGDADLDIKCNRDTSAPETIITPLRKDTTGKNIYGLNMNLLDQVEVLDNNPWTILGDESKYLSLIGNWRNMRTFYCVDEAGTCYPSKVLKTTPDEEDSLKPYIIDLTKEVAGFGPSSNGKMLKLRFFSEDPARNLELIQSIDFKLDALAPVVVETHDIDPTQISLYQWISDVTFSLTLDSYEESVPIECSFTLTPANEANAITFKFNGNDENNMPSINNPLGNLLYNAIGSEKDHVEAKYYGLTDGLYKYKYSCVDAVGNSFVSTEKDLVIDGDLRIANPTPYDEVYRSTDIINNKKEISITTNNPGTCLYSTTLYNYNLMDSVNNRFSNPDSNGKRVATVDIPTVNPSRIYRYFVACELNINGEDNIVSGSDADNPYFSIDDLSPVTTLMFRDPNSQPVADAWTEYNYDESKIYDGLVLKLECSDNNPLLQTSSGYDMTFGCEDTMYYCIPHDGTTCYDTSEYEEAIVNDNNEIVLSYGGLNSVDKEMYGNTPNIFYYSKDKGGNIENFRTMKLNVRNTRMDNPLVSFVESNSEFDNPNIEIINGVEVLNNYHGLLEIKYTNEKVVTISDIKVENIKDNTLVAIEFGSSSVTATDSIKLYNIPFIPVGEYKLIVSAVDDDGNVNNYDKRFNVNHTGNGIQMVTPKLGIGDSNPYQFIFKTKIPSTCKYGFATVSACNYNPDGSYSDNALSCWYNDARYIPIIRSDGIEHEVVNTQTNLFDDGGTSDFISNNFIHLVCKIEGYESNSNSAYVLRSFRYGHLTTAPTVNIQYVLDPIIDNIETPNYNVIINEDSPKITINVETDQLSVCTINMDHQINAFDLINEPFTGEANTEDFMSYQLTHTYTIDYTGKGVTDQDILYEFEYEIKCTNVAQLSTSTNAEVIVNIDRTPPVAGTEEVSSYLTLKEYRATCTDHCTNAFQYKLVETGSDCADVSVSYSGDQTYDSLIPVVESSRLCLKVKDVLGREAVSGFDIDVVPFNKGAMDIVYPYEYSGYNGKITSAYSPTNTFELMVRTGSETDPVGALCVYGVSSGQYSDMSHEEIYESLLDANRQFGVTGIVGSEEDVNVHTEQNFEINTDENTAEAWIIICKAFNTAPGAEPYISREVFFYWDSTLPSVNTESAETIYDWNNRLETDIEIITDDDTMCKIIDSTETPSEELLVDDSDDTLFESYVKERTYTYTIPSKYSQYLEAVGDMTLKVECINRAKESYFKDITIHYEIDKQVDAVTNLEDSAVFSSKQFTVNATTDIMSTCTLTIDDGAAQTMVTTDRLYHFKDLDLEGGKHNIIVTCRVPENNNIGRFIQEYEVYVDLTPPIVELIGPNSINGQDTTCNIDGFTINVVMSDAESSVESYEYSISGDGITPDYIIADSGNLNSISVPPVGSIIKNNRTYTVRVEAKDKAGNVGGSSIYVRTFNPETGVTCDHIGPNIDTITTYHTSSSKNFAVVEAACEDLTVTGSDSSMSSGCSQYFRYSFEPGIESCSGATYDNEASYDNKLIFFEDKGTLCIQGKDLSGNPTNVQTYIDINPITCGNGVIEKRLEPGYFGLETLFDNWNWNSYGSLLDEECDGNNLAGNTCLTQGFVGGSLSCNPSTCVFDTTSCTDGMPVTLVSPKPFGIGSLSSYTLTVNAEYNAQCRYGLLNTADASDIISAYNGALMNDMTALTDGSRNHERNIGPLSIAENYVVRYAVCHMNDISIAPTPAQEYGIAKIYEGFDTTAPQITSITTDKLNDKIIDFNNREISILVETNEDSICELSDSVNTVTDYTMYGNKEDYDSYSKSHVANIDYSDLTQVPNGGLITLTVKCYNKAGLSTEQNKDIYYDIATSITIEKVSPPEDYIVGYVATYAVKTNIESDCYVSNGTVNRLMDGTGLYHEKAVGITDGWNTITITCTDPNPVKYAYPGVATYRIYGGANNPIGMNIETTEYTCSLSSINAKLSAVRTTLDIKHYTYTVTDLATSVVLCAGNSVDGNLACSASIVDGRSYIIESYAVDTSNHESEHAFSVVMGSDSTNNKCDNTNPTLSIARVSTGYNDFERLNVSCIDTGTPSSGCKDYHYYSLIENDGSSCANANYVSTKSYGIFDVTEDGVVCVKGSDNNDNYDYENITIDISSNNYINIVPLSAQISPKYVPLKVIATSTIVTDLDFKTDVSAVCKYSTLAPTATDNSVLYTSYSAFTDSNAITHKIASFNTNSIEEQFIDVICFADSETPDRKYSRVSFIIVYLNESPSVNATLNPDSITDWFERQTEISTETNTKTVCSITTNDGQHNALTIGQSDDYTTYSNNQYLMMYYDVNTFTPSTYYYVAECRDYLGRSAESRVTLAYNLPTTLDIEIISPRIYASRDINIIAQTNILGNCTLTFDGVSQGLMYTDLSGKNHITRLTGLADKTYIVGISCAAPVRNLEGSITYNITINTTVPAPLCGDSLVQRPNSNGKVEDCDGTDLNGKSCTNGFVTTSYIGGQLRCKSDCTFDFTNCDNGKGWCGNGEVDGPNSNNLFEQCDGSIPSGMTCEKLGFKGGGKLACSNGCMVNTTGCLQEGQIAGVGFYSTCNNNQLESGEQCEIGGNITNIFCKSFGYDYGSISCGSNCMFAMNSCSINNTKPNSGSGSNNNSTFNCGNGRKDSGEDCDRTATGDGLFTTACKIANTNYTSGTLSCTANCKYDFTSCVGSASSSTDASKLCNNSLKDTTESDIDCGGPCDACGLDKLCVANSDCESEKCTAGRCAVNTCKNTILDLAYGETDVDCGGTNCDACKLDKTCIISTDCESGYCTEGKCAEDPCSNGQLDIGEADIDCGGNCVLCSAGFNCATDDDCSTGVCEDGKCIDLNTEEEKNPAKTPLIWVGLLSMLGSGGYIIYRTFYSHMPTSTARTSVGTMHTGQVATPQRPTMSPEQQRAILEKQHELLEKKRQERSSARKSFMEKLSDSVNPKTETKVEEKIEAKTTKPASDEEEFVDISKLKNDKDRSKAETFSKLKEIGKGQELSKSKVETTTDKIETHNDALKMFGKVDRDIIMSKVFKDVLSKLLVQERISKENVSKILFEYMDKGMITKAEVAKLSSELKII